MGQFTYSVSSVRVLWVLMSLPLINLVAEYFLAKFGVLIILNLQMKADEHQNYLDSMRQVWIQVI